MQADRNLVITVTESDRETGTMEKMDAHRTGTLHRAFSVFVLNNKNELLLQRRAMEKYHSGGLWTNTCCSHPMPGEKTDDAAVRRLQEELGFTCHLLPAFEFTYKADVGDGLTEHEYDHVFIGSYSDICKPDATEVMDWKYIGLTDLAAWIEREPTAFTTWMRIAFPRFIAYVSNLNQGYQY